MPKKILTQEDLDQNPELVEQGLKVGDEIEIPSPETNADANTETNEGGEPEDGEGDGENGNGGNNPPKKPPFTPEP